MLITTVIVVFLTLTCSKIIKSDIQPYQIQQFNDKSGIFYHQLGQARISYDKFTLLSFINISIYEEKLKLTNTIYQTSLPLCINYRKFSNATRTKKIEYSCNETLTLISNKFKLLDEKFDSICHLTGHNLDIISRSRRGLFNGVSYAIKWLFGTPDADDAKFYTDAINNISQQNQDMHMLMKQQVHILSDAISEYNKTAQALIYNQDILNKNIISFNKFANSTAKRINSLTFAQTVTNQINLLTQLINELKEEFDVIISAILFSKQNIVHPIVITPRHLKDELLKIKITSSLEFAFDIDKLENAYKFMDISSLSVIYSNKILIFAIGVPLVTKNIFNIYNLIPLPTQFLNSSIYSYINPSFSYLLLSTTRNFYSELTDLSNCIHVPPQDYICKHATIYLVKERPTCELDLKTQQLLTIPKSCDTKVVKTEVEIWHPLNKNQWLFVVTNPVLGTIYCDYINRAIDITIQNTGIFTLQPQCKCYTMSTMLIATSNQTSNYTNYIPTVDITMDDCCLIEQEYLRNEEMESIKLSNINLNDLNHAQNKLHQFDEELQKRIDEPFSGYRSKWYNTLGGSFALIFFFLLILWCCCKQCRWSVLSWLKRLFTRGPCQYSICINSHNSMENSEVNTYDVPRQRRVRFIREDSVTNPIYSRPHMPSPKEDRPILEADSIDPHDYAHLEFEDVELDPSPRRITRSLSKKIFKI